MQLQVNTKKRLDIKCVYNLAYYEMFEPEKLFITEEQYFIKTDEHIELDEAINFLESNGATVPMAMTMRRQELINLLT